MDRRLLTVAIGGERDLVLVRTRARRIAELVGFDRQDQTRITTAISEIARNALDYGRGGRVEFALAVGRLVITVCDTGPGIADLDAVLSGAHKSDQGMGIGLLGAQRLMDEFRIDTAPARGTVVRMEKRLPPSRAALEPAAIARRLSEDGPADPMEEIRHQNQQIMLQLQELQQRQDQLTRLNQELQDTNRGVVALYAELDERADHLRRADELKSKFLSHMSHEFRTPLNSILALSRLLLDRTDGELTQEQEKQVGFIRKGAQNLTELVDDLLDLARVEAGKTIISPSRFTATELFGALRGMLRPLLVGDAVTLVFEEPVDCPVLETDEGKLSQILRNFISNAIKFTERGEVRVSASADLAAGTVTFSVRDTGIGIAPEDQELIFQEFGQIAHSLQRRVKGTGLGLPLSKKLAELLGGRVEVDSTLGQGSTFSVTLPLRLAVPSDLPAPGAGWEPDPGKTQVLVLEDDPADALVIDRLLAGSAYQPLLAHSVQQAEQILGRLTPSVVLLDVALANDESWRLLLHIRKRDSAAGLPVVVVSSGGEDRKAIHLGADEYLAKPLEGGKLIGLLDRLTGRQTIARLLVVDDEEIACYLVRQLLPRSQFAISVASGGTEALRRLATERPDLILLDLNMPGMDGYELLAALKQSPELASIPVVILTSASLIPADRARLHEATSILSKSDLAPRFLMDAVNDALGQHHPAGVR